MPVLVAQVVSSHGQLTYDIRTGRVLDGQFFHWYCPKGLVECARSFEPVHVDLRGVDPLAVMDILDVDVWYEDSATLDVVREQYMTAAQREEARRG